MTRNETCKVDEVTFIAWQTGAGHERIVSQSFAVVVMLLPFAAQAESWPSRPIKAVFPFGAGSAADVLPCLVFDRLAIEPGQPIIIENRVGAGGTIGTAVAKADPDGYTILSHSSALTAAPALFPNLGYDAARDFGADAGLQRQCDDHPGVAAVENRATVHH